MFARPQNVKNKSQLSERGQNILQKISAGDVAGLQALQLTLADLFEADSDLTSLIAHAQQKQQQGILNLFFKIILNAHLITDTPGTINTTVRCKYGYTLLHWAVYCRQDLSLIDFLISLQCDIDARSETHKTPLYMAWQYGYTDAINTLLSRGANPNLGDAKGSTILHGAARAGNDIMVRFFISQGANIFQPDEKGITALDIAICQGHVAVVAAILECCTTALPSSKTTKTAMMKLVESSPKVLAMVTGYLLAFDTEEVILPPEKLAALVGQTEITRILREFQTLHRPAANNQTLPIAVEIDTVPVEKSADGKRLRESGEIKAQISPAISGLPNLTFAVPGKPDDDRSGQSSTKQSKNSGA